MVKHLVQSTQGSQFETFLDEDGIKDIAEVIKTDVELFSKDEQDKMSSSVMIQSKKQQEKDEDDNFDRD